MTFGGLKLATCGKAIVPYQHNGKQFKIEFEAIDQDVSNLFKLSTSSIQELGNTTNFSKKYKDIYTQFSTLICPSTRVEVLLLHPSESVIAI